MGKKKGFDLDKIDKILAQFPDEDEAGGKPQQDSASQSGSPAAKARPQSLPSSHKGRPAVGAWTRVFAGLVLAGAITQWPYGHSCGLGLFAYIIAIGGVLAVGVWAASHTWQAHLHVPHLLSLAVVLWGLGMGLFQILPRIGYAKKDASWLCGTPTAAPSDSIAEPGQKPREEVAPTEAESQAAARMATDSTVPIDSMLPADSATASDSVPGTIPDTTALTERPAVRREDADRTSQDSTILDRDDQRHHRM